jgi:hypothetical protein
MAISMKPFAYVNGVVPDGYACTCGKTGCKLYREYNTFMSHQELYCVDCAAKDQGKTTPSEAPDQIGWLVAAVPTEDGSTFWGYTSVPDAGCVWWRGLPLRAA